MSFSQEDQQKYKALYLQTARQYIKDLYDNLSKLSQGNQSTDLVDTLHRDAHSLKGQSQMMGYIAVSSVSSLIEHIFAAKKEDKLTLSDEIIKQLIAAVDATSQCLEEIDKTNKETDLTQFVQSLQSLTSINA